MQRDGPSLRIWQHRLSVVDVVIAALGLLVAVVGLGYASGRLTPRRTVPPTTLHEASTPLSLASASPVSDVVLLAHDQPQRIDAFGITLSCRFDTLGGEPFGELTVTGDVSVPQTSLLHALQRSPLSILTSNGQVLLSVTNVDYRAQSVGVLISRSVPADSSKATNTPSKGNP